MGIVKKLSPQKKRPCIHNNLALSPLDNNSGYHLDELDTLWSLSGHCLVQYSCQQIGFLTRAPKRAKTTSVCVLTVPKRCTWKLAGIPPLKQMEFEIGDSLALQNCTWRAPRFHTGTRREANMTQREASGNRRKLREAMGSKE